MVDNPKTSFIPKQAMGNVSGRASPRRRHFNVLNFIGMVVFLCGMILAVGVFLYKGSTEDKLASKKQELQDIKNSFSQGDIEELRELDRRISIARALLNGHLSPSVVFDALELRTQRDVTFTDFSYEQRESGSVELVLEGTALRFNTVALQSKQLTDATVLASTIFSDLDVDEDGHVHFTATSEGDTTELVYNPVRPAAAPVPIVSTTTSTTAPTGGQNATSSATAGPVSTNIP